ncbi:MAG: hypothetical protein MPW14_04265 [Candidatus Manganitrophus sp.]|nr:MAG: hypothetical protein MPW14_04265 [Candidatus Manganitrophus sp.]
MPPGFQAIARTADGAPVAAIVDERPARNFYGVQFHPEVVHTARGAQILPNFRAQHRWAASRLDDARLPQRSRDRQHPRAGRRGPGVICGLSGGVDTAVAAVLAHEAIGDQLTCVFVDNGLMREGEAEAESSRSFAANLS